MFTTPNSKRKGAAAFRRRCVRDVGQQEVQQPIQQVLVGLNKNQHSKIAEAREQIDTLKQRKRDLMAAEQEERRREADEKKRKQAQTLRAGRVQSAEAKADYLKGFDSAQRDYQRRHGGRGGGRRDRRMRQEHANEK